MMTTNGVTGTTSSTDGSNSLEGYSVPKEAQKLLDNGILKNPLIADTLPDGVAEAASTVRFEGSSKPSIPINWRFAESISALKGLEAALINVLLSRKYGLEAQEAVIDTYVSSWLELKCTILMMQRSCPAVLHVHPVEHN